MDYRAKKNYVIEYQALNVHGVILKQGKVKAKNKASEFEALAGLENHLKAQIPFMTKLKCVSIIDDSITQWVEDILKSKGL